MGIRLASFLVLSFSSLLLLGWVDPAAAQPAEEAESPAPAPREQPALTVEEVDSAIAEVEQQEGLETAIKDALLGRYNSAIEALNRAEEFRGQAASYDESLQTGASETERLRAELDELPTRAQPVDETAATGSETLRQEIASGRADASSKKTELDAAEAEVTRLVGRPVAINERLPEITAELNDPELAEAGVSTDDSPSRKADQTLLVATRESLLAERVALERELASQQARLGIAEARRDLLARQYSLVAERVDALQALANEQLKSELDLLLDRALAALESVPEGSGTEEVDSLREEVKQLVDEVPNLSQQLLEIDRQEDELKEKSEALSTESSRLRKQGNLGGLDGAFAQVLRQQLRQLPNPNAYRARLISRHEELNTARLNDFNLGDKLRTQNALEEASVDWSEPARELVAVRGELLRKMSPATKSLVDDIVLLDAAERRYLVEAEDFREFLTQGLFWTRDSAPVGLGNFAGLPSSIAWVFGPQRVSELGPAFLGVLKRNPLLSAVVGLFVIFLLFRRPRIEAGLVETGKRVRRISRDEFRYTLKAFSFTVLLAVPLPLLLGYLGWGMNRDPAGSEWLEGVSRGLLFSAVVTFGYLFLAHAARPDGLGIAHFGWKEYTAERLRRALFLIVIVFVPCLLIFFATFSEDDPRHLDSLGLTSFLVSSVWMSVIAGISLFPYSGFSSKAGKPPAHRILLRMGKVWFVLIVGFPLFLVVLALLGYLLTAQALCLISQATLGIVALGIIFYGLIYRWFNVKERKLALAEAVERRRARAEEREDAEESHDEDEGIAIAEEEELDIADVGRQTRRLLRSLVSIVVILAAWQFWRSTMPIEETLRGITLPGGMNLLGLFLSILILVVTVVVTRNLPGLLELAGLRATGLDAGVRYAIATLAQYAVIFFGSFALFASLNLDWSQFGWIAAALSVGLGFGLQEIVANFICGIILLFERPFRPGDIVTVDGVTGTVTKLRMRATTITNWDRQEFVIPNKNFITGTLLNWTLSSTINRLVINVGVAYGCDVEKALQILLDAAKDHPRVMEEPAPFVTFDNFGDSSLDLILRAYMADMDGRAGVFTDLRVEIDRRFREAGIEIPFPQRDLHLRSVDEGVNLG